MLSRSLKKKESLKYGATWMNLEGMVLSEINQSQKDKWCTFYLYVVSKIANPCKHRVKLVDWMLKNILLHSLV